MPEPLLHRPTIYGARAKLGVIVPPTDTTNEAEWNRLAPAQVSIHAARMPLHIDTTTPAGRRALIDDIKHYSADLAQARVSVIAYGCTAGSLVTPVNALANLMQQHTGIASLSTAQAIVQALRHLNVTSIAVATPYHQAMNEHEAAFLREQGFDVVAIRGLGYGQNGPEEFRNIAHVDGQTVMDLVLRTCEGAAVAPQAILISCTDLATLNVIPALEEELKLPVISSNTATLWAALSAAGIADEIELAGRLLALPRAKPKLPPPHGGNCQ